MTDLAYFCAMPDTSVNRIQTAVAGFSMQNSGYTLFVQASAYYTQLINANEQNHRNQLGFIVLRSQMNDYTVTDAKAAKRKNAGNDQSYFHGRPY